MEMLSSIAFHIPSLLRLYWVLAAGSVVATLLPLPLPQAFKDAVRLSAARGKLWEDRPLSLGPLSNAAVPQSWFLHFYLVGAVCNALVCAALSASLQGMSSTQGTEDINAMVLLAAFQVHLVRRALETKLVMRYPAHARMHCIAYFFGLSYYIATPLSLLPASAAQDLFTAKRFPGFGILFTHLATTLERLSCTGMFGLAVFALGNILQLWSHHHLASLQKPALMSGNQKGYTIPRGGLFEYVSCPHYSSEIVIYLGLFIASGFSSLIGLIVIWVVVNLVLAAGATHKWYFRTFKNYPRRRRALVPGVF